MLIVQQTLETWDIWYKNNPYRQQSSPKIASLHAFSLKCNVYFCRIEALQFIFHETSRCHMPFSTNYTPHFKLYRVTQEENIRKNDTVEVRGNILFFISAGVGTLVGSSLPLATRHLWPNLFNLKVSARGVDFTRASWTTTEIRLFELNQIITLYHQSNMLSIPQNI